VSTRIRNLPDTPVGRAVDWLLDNSGPGDCDVAAVEAHFAPSFVSQLGAEKLLELMKSSPDWMRTAEVEVLAPSSFSMQVALIVQGDARAVLDAAVEEEEPHRITSALVRPPGAGLAEIIEKAEPVTGALAEAVDERFDPIRSLLDAGGVVVGISRGGAREVFPLGADANLRYEIGSITKTFTATLLADMSLRGEVALGDPVRTYLPDGVGVPREGDREITLEDLATHSSGLPRVPPNMMEGSDPSNPYAHIDEARLYEELAATTLDFPIGSKSAYSNFGFGLLGHVLARAAGRQLADLMRERITAPLGMDRTEFAPTGDDLAQGFMGKDAGVRWTGEMVYGAGCGFESTIDDMLTYGEANADPESTPIAAAINEAHRERLRMDDLTAVALGWVRITLKDGTVAFFHNGGTGSFSSSLVCHPPTKTVVAALCNAAGTLLDAATIALTIGLAAGS